MSPVSLFKPSPVVNETRIRVSGVDIRQIIITDGSEGVWVGMRSAKGNTNWTPSTRPYAAEVQGMKSLMQNLGVFEEIEAL